MIEPSQLKTAQKPTKTPQKTSSKTKSAPKAAAKQKKATAPKDKSPASLAKFYNISDFAEMTYLTENGVMHWLKQGRLTGQRDSNGEWQVDAANLEVPDVKRLVR